MVGLYVCRKTVRSLGILFFLGWFAACTTTPYVFVPHRFDQYETRFRAKVAHQGMVVSDDLEASRWAVEVLKQGGNAVDAAVAAAFVLAVTRPHYAALGGGGFLLSCPEKEGLYPSPCSLIDYRERAPLKANKNLYIENGKVMPKKARVGALASGIPGVVAGLLFALEKHGTFSRTQILKRPIALATQGVLVTGVMEKALKKKWSDFNLEAKRIFSCGHLERPCQAGEKVIQKDLAKLLKNIARYGKRAFYDSAFSKKLVSEVQKAGGIWTLEDLKTYPVYERKPLVGRFLDHEIVTTPPPSAGGVLLLQNFAFLSFAQEQKLFQKGWFSKEAVHAMAHGFLLSFLDRAKWIGDPDFVSIPLQKMMSLDRLKSVWKKTFQKSMRYRPKEIALPLEGTHTTHLSVIDKNGGAVSLTTTVNSYFGAAFIPSGTGLVLNNEMDDFSIQSGTSNLYGLVGTQVNAITPRKTPVSSMAPTIVRNLQGDVQFSLGAQGGTRIPTAIFQTLMNRFVFGMSFPDALIASRVHFQWKPDVLYLEPYSVPFALYEKLKTLGYLVEVQNRIGVVNGIERKKDGTLFGVADPRGEGVAVGF